MDPATPPPGPFDATDHRMMTRALDLARRAAAQGEVPVGAVIARQGEVVAEAHNLRETLYDPTAHAERLALAEAGREFRSWRLDGCTLYVTLEPCPMCAGAIVLARVERVVYAVPDWKWGACRSLFRLLDDPRSNHQVRVSHGLLADDCRPLLSQFFLERRDTPRRGA